MIMEMFREYTSKARVCLPIKDSGLFEHVAKIDVGVQKVGIQSDGFLEVMNRQPYFSLGVEDAAKIAPCDREVWTRFNRL